MIIVHNNFVIFKSTFVNLKCYLLNHYHKKEPDMFDSKVKLKPIITNQLMAQNFISNSTIICLL